MTETSVAFNPSALAEFSRGIFSRDPARVRAALAAGVSPDTHVEGMHPLIPLLMGSFKGSRISRKKLMNEDAYDACTTEIVNLLLEAGVKVAEEEKYATQGGRYLVDRLLLSTRLGDLSNVILHAIEETAASGRDPYRPEIFPLLIAHGKAMMREIGAIPDPTAQVSFIMTTIEQVHGVVRKRLEQVTGEKEEILNLLYPEAVGYWTSNFTRPALEATVDAFVGEFMDDPRHQPQEEASPLQIAASAFSAEMRQYVVTLEKKDPAQVLAETEADFIGMEAQKKSLRRMFYRQQFNAVRASGGVAELHKNHGTVMLGNPGLGKTTFARKKAEMLVSLGLSGPRYVEITRENAVGGFVGHTEQKMVALFSQADIIFIDETYNLYDGRDSGSQDYGRRVMDALMTVLERRPDVTVFMAGYPEIMNEMLSSNPGLKSRIGTYEAFADMDSGQLGKVLDLRLDKAGLQIELDAKEEILRQLEEVRKAVGVENFGHAREVRKVVEALPDVLAERHFSLSEADVGALVLAPDPASVSKVTLQDVNALEIGSLLGAKLVKPDRKEVGFHVAR